MKHLIPAGAAVLVLGICGLVPRQGASPGAVWETGLSRVAPGMDRRQETRETPAPGRKESTSLPEAPTRVVLERAVPAEEIRDLRTVLCAKLELTEVQGEIVSAALKARIRDLRDCHETYRRNGVFLPLAYGRQLARMKETWYCAIDQVLDSRQHDSFDALVRNGIFRPGTEFEADLNEMIVVW